MSMNKSNEVEWDYIQGLIKYTNIKTFQDFHNFYLDININGFVDVLENFTQTSIKHYKLEPCNYVETPSFAWKALSLKSKLKLEILNDVDTILFFEKGIQVNQQLKSISKKQKQIFG